MANEVQQPVQLTQKERLLLPGYTYCRWVSSDTVQWIWKEIERLFVVEGFRAGCVKELSMSLLTTESRSYVQD